MKTKRNTNESEYHRKHSKEETRNEKSKKDKKN